VQQKIFYLIFILSNIKTANHIYDTKSTQPKYPCDSEASPQLDSRRSNSLNLSTSAFSSRISLAFGSSLTTALQTICLARSAYLNKSKVDKNVTILPNLCYSPKEGQINTSRQNVHVTNAFTRWQHSSKAFSVQSFTRGPVMPACGFSTIFHLFTWFLAPSNTMHEEVTRSRKQSAKLTLTTVIIRHSTPHQSYRFTASIRKQEREN